MVKHQHYTFHYEGPYFHSCEYVKKFVKSMSLVKNEEFNKKYPLIYKLNFIFERFINDENIYDLYGSFLDIIYMIENNIIIIKELKVNIDKINSKECLSKKLLKYVFDENSEGHDKFKFIGACILGKKGGDPREEVLISYGKADVYCKKLNIAIECGYTPMQRFFEGIWDLKEFWVYPYSQGMKQDEFIKFMSLTKEERKKSFDEDVIHTIYRFKKGKNWDIMIKRYNQIEKDEEEKIKKLPNLYFKS